MDDHTIAAGSPGDVAHGLGFEHHVDRTVDKVSDADGESQGVDGRFVDDRLQQLRTLSAP